MAFLKLFTKKEFNPKKKRKEIWGVDVKWVGVSSAWSILIA